MHVAYIAAIAIWLSGCLPALAWGGWPERLVGGALLGDLGLSLLLPVLVRRGAMQACSAAVDFAVLALMIAVAAWRPRAWLIAATGFQFVAVLVHVPHLLDPGVRWWAYAVVNNYSGFAVVLALLVGTILHRREGDPDVAKRRV